MSKTSNIVNINEQYTELYNSNADEIKAGLPDTVNQLRGKAKEQFAQLGIPSNKVEEYKYTNLQPFFKGKLTTSFQNNSDIMDLEAAFKCAVPELKTHSVFTVNGWYSNQNNKFADYPEGVEVGSLAEMAGKHPELFEKYYGQLAPADTDGLVAMNTLFAQSGIVIYIKKGTVVEKPIQIVNVLTGNDDLLAFQRNLIVVEENCQAKIMVCDHTLSPNKFVVNTVTEVFVAENSVFDVYGLQHQHNLTTQVAGIYIKQQKHSNVLTNILALHAGMCRNNISILLDDEHCESHLYGLYLNDKNQHVDNHTFIDHAKPHCTSFELFKGVLDDFATGAFTGRVLVRQDAQQTNAYQTNNNLLLTDNAKINTKPQLEIYADDVKCSHGATVGQLDKEAMFYIRSRGINEQEARVLLMYAFAYEVIEKIRVEPLKEQIRGLVEKRFRGELDKCDNCVVCGQVGTEISCL